MQRGKKKEKKKNNSQYFKACHLTSRLILSLLPTSNAFSTWASHRLVKGLFIKGSPRAKGLHLLRKISKQIHK
jgi:hypothetical protein